MITEPGAYSMSLEAYLADPCPLPSLNHSIAQILLRKTPWHAKLAHPRFTPEPARNDSTAFDLGQAVHRLALEGEEAFLEIRAADWRTTAAKAKRLIARDRGVVPLLSHQIEAVRAMARMIRVQCEAFPAPIPLEDGEPERVLCWKEGEIWCRARLDWLHFDRKTIDDLKTTSASAHPAEWTRGLVERGHDLQAAFYIRGVHQVYGIRPDFRFVVAEIDPPHAVSCIDLDPEALEFAHTRRLRALERWARCLRTDDWPGYPRRTISASVPPWELTREQEAVYYEEASHGPDRPRDADPHGSPAGP